MTPRASAALLGLVGLAAHPAAAMPSAEGRQLAGSCAACHQPGVPGSGAHTVIPPIMGLDEGRTVSLMLAYRSGARPSQVMHVVANALSAEEIAAVARYLAGQGEQP